MAFYRATIHKEHSLTHERWSNVYLLSASDVFDASAAATAVVSYEQAVTYDIVTFTELDIVNRADSLDRLSVALGGTGDLHHDTVGFQLPIFCVTLVTFTDRIKKPEHKFIRSPGWSDRITAGASWDTDWILGFHNLYVNPLLSLTAYVGPSGERPSAGTVYSPIHNRQVGWHRRTRPGFKRGWVPV